MRGSDLLGLLRRLFSCLGSGLSLAPDRAQRLELVHEL
jgi:hypothetical protein